MFLTVNQTELLTAKKIIEESLMVDAATTTVAPPPLLVLQQTSDIVRANFDWPEQVSEQISGHYHNNNAPTSILNNNQKFAELSPLLPFGMMLIVSTVVFILIIFRRWPGLVAGIVAGCLTSISIYLLLLTLREQKLVYE